ncbi:MAG: hypothetical protein TU35_009820 [Thermoproteus sp. AZ2]|uniref:Uncharacterized protein n=1 Tax=Thermoproteus sp. AZ2 TaxID=1609232 RepID=A0ACC6V374_9CREN
MLIEVVEDAEGRVAVINGDQIACVLSSMGLVKRGAVWEAQVFCEEGFVECLLDQLERRGIFAEVRYPKLSPLGVMRAYIVLGRRGKRRRAFRRALYDWPPAP